MKFLSLLLSAFIFFGMTTQVFSSEAQLQKLLRLRILSENLQKTPLIESIPFLEEALLNKELFSYDLTDVTEILQRFMTESAKPAPAHYKTKFADRFKNVKRLGVASLKIFFTKEPTSFQRSVYQKFFEIGDFQYETLLKAYGPKDPLVLYNNMKFATAEESVESRNQSKILDGLQLATEAESRASRNESVSGNSIKLVQTIAIPGDKVLQVFSDNVVQVIWANSGRIIREFKVFAGTKEFNVTETTLIVSGTDSGYQAEYNLENFEFIRATELKGFCRKLF